MEPENILDSNFEHSMQKYLFESEGIEWKGEPNPKFSITLLEIGGHHDVMTGSTSILGFVLGGMLIFGYIFYNQENWLAFALTIIVGLSIIIIPDVLKHKRKRHTKYAFTNNRAFFQLWRWGKKSVHFIDFADVGKITYEEYPDKSGVIHFLPKTPFDFFTHDFFTGNKRFYPTFEMIPNVIDLQKRLEELKKERIKIVKAKLL